MPAPRMSSEDDISPRRLIAAKDKEIAMLRKMVERTREGKVKKLNSKYRQFKKNTQEAWKTNQAMLKEHSEKYYQDKMKLDLIFKSHYLDGVTTYSLIRAWSRIESLTDDQTMLLIILAHYNWFTFKDAEVFGMSRTVATGLMTVLQHEGYAEKFTQGMKISYVLTTKGQRKFEEIHKYVKAGFKLLFVEMDKKRVFNPKVGGSGVMVMGKFMGERGVDEYKLIEKMHKVYDANREAKKKRKEGD